MSTNSSNTGTNSSSAAATSSTPSTEKANWSFSTPTPETPTTETPSASTPSPSIEVEHNSPECSTSPSDGSCSPSKLSFSYPGLTYGQALEALKQGVKVCRASWTGDAYCWLKPASIIEETWVKDPYLKEAIAEFGFETPVSGSSEDGTCLGIVDLSTICLKSSDNHIITGWCPSSTDMLSDDWCICEITK